MSLLILLALAAAVRFAVRRRAVSDPRLGALAPPESATRMLPAPSRIAGSGAQDLIDKWKEILATPLALGPWWDDRVGCPAPDAGEPAPLPFPDAASAEPISSVVASQYLEGRLLRTLQCPTTHEILVQVMRGARSRATPLDLERDRTARLYLPSRPIVLISGLVVRIC